MSVLRPGILALVVSIGACGGSNLHPWVAPAQRDTNDDPSQLRPGYGNEELHLWWPVTDAEASALKGLDKAKAGDPHALLALAVLAAGDHRDQASYDAFQARVDKAVSDMRPSVEGAADDWHKGYEVNRAMHKTFFSQGKGDLGGYLFQQGKITGIFDTGRYNCISSSMLFAVLARSFGMNVRTVMVPTHAFVELTLGGKVLEVETTTPTGFDWVHDERFYREAAARWSSERGLRPVTLDDYNHREIIDPYRLIGHDVVDANVAAGADEQERARRRELWASIDPENGEAAEQRLAVYNNEVYAFHQAKASRTLVKMAETVAPAVSDAASRFGKNPKLMKWAMWVGWYYADSLAVVSRGDEAVAIANDALDRMDDSIDDATKLRENFLAVLSSRMLELGKANDFARASQVVSKHLDMCRNVDWCAGNLRWVMLKPAIDAWNAGDWPTARKGLQDCLAQLPNDSECTSKLQDLESQHRF